MTELNKFQQEIESLLQKADKATDKRLYNLYIDTIKDLKKSLLVDYQRLDDLTSSQRLKLSQMSTLLEQLDQSASKLKKGLKSEITGHLIDTGKVAYNELFYEFENSHAGINFAMLKEDELKTIIETPVANFKLSERLDDGVVERLKNNIKDDLNRIFLHGASYAQASARLAEQGYSSYRRAMMITRTEAGRVQAVARQKSQMEAERLGIEFDKMWVATLDGRTRHNHAELDGVRVKPDDYFEINGLKTKQPHMFGFASEDVNCRCRTISRLKGDDTPLLRRDNETGEVVEYRNYREWIAGKEVTNNGSNQNQVGNNFHWLENPNGKKQPYTEEQMKAMMALKTESKIYDNLNPEKIDDFFKQQSSYQKWYNRIKDSADERKAVVEYTMTGHESINNILRMGYKTYEKEYLSGFDPEDIPYAKSVLKERLQTVQDLQKAIQGYQTEYSFRVFRGTRTDKDFFEKLVVGDVSVIDKGFLSTSLNKNEALNFSNDGYGDKYLLDIIVPKGSKNGVYISEFSDMPEEKEFLIMPNTKFKVISVKKSSSDLKIISLELQND